MERPEDIRWIQRFDNYHKACGWLLEVTEGDFLLATCQNWRKKG